MKNEWGEEMTGYKQCPHCAETVKGQAIVCKHCGNNLDSDEPNSFDDKVKRFFIISGLLVVLIWAYSNLLNVYKMSTQSPLDSDIAEFERSVDKLKKTLATNPEKLEMWQSETDALTSSDLDAVQAFFENNPELKDIPLNDEELNSLTDAIFDHRYQQQDSVDSEDWIEIKRSLQYSPVAEK